MTTPFPIAALPSCLQSFPRALSAAAPVTIEFATATCLGVLSAALGSGAVLHDGERRLRPNLYLLTVAPEGLDRATCFRLAYQPLAARQATLDQALGSARQPELTARRHQLTREWSRIANDHGLSDRDRDARLIENDLDLGRLELEASADPHIFLTQIPRGKLLSQLANRPHQSVSFFSADAARPAQVLRGSLRAHALDEDTYLAAYAGHPISSAQRFENRRTAPDPCVALHWSLTPTVWHSLLTAKTPSPLLHRFLYVNPSTPPGLLSGSVPLSLPVGEQESETYPKANSALSDLPDDLLTITASVKAAWSALIENLLHLRANVTPVNFPVTAEARHALRAYENEIRRHLRNTTDSWEHSFASHHPDTAWRLALLLHTAESASAHQNSEPGDSTDLSKLTPTPLPGAIAIAAIALTRWFASQHRLLAEQLRTQPDKPLLAKLTHWLEQAGGALTLGQLTDRHNLPAPEARRLATTYPHLLQLTDSAPGTRGRRSQTLALRTSAPPPPPIPAPLSTAPAAPAARSTPISPIGPIGPIGPTPPDISPESPKSNLSEPLIPSKTPLSFETQDFSALTDEELAQFLDDLNTPEDPHELETRETHRAEERHQEKPTPPPQSAAAPTDRSQPALGSAILLGAAP